MKKLTRFFFETPKSLNDLFFKSGILVLVGLCLLVSIKLIDGNTHRLGVIVIQPNHNIKFIP